MKLIIGLGNPGKEYEKTRHNVGFMVIDEICKELNVSLDKAKFKGIYTKTKYRGEDIILYKPLTYMNLSGEGVVEVINFFKIKREDIIVIYDDLDLNIGTIRLKTKGSSGGQKGMGNIINILKTNELNRIKVGIGKNPLIPTVNYVLGKFSQDQQIQLDQALISAKDAALAFCHEDMIKLMSKYN